MILLAAATFLAVISSELAASLEHESRGYEGRLTSRYDEGSQKFGEGSVEGQDVNDDRIYRSEGGKNPNQNLNGKESEDFDQSNESNWLDAVPGVPGKDYPNLESIPKTSFSCADKKPGGYYADIETRCQVFHVCNVGGVKSSFLCPPGSIFNQKYLVCDWWYDFECENASDLYSLNESINRGEVGSGPAGPGEYYTADKSSKLTSEKESSFAYQESNWVNESVDLSLAGTGEGGLGYSRNKSNRPFGNYQTNVNQGTQFGSQPNGNTDLTKQLGRQTTLGNDRRNELSQRRSNQQNEAQNAAHSIYSSPTNNDRVTIYDLPKAQSFNARDQYFSFQNENSKINNIQRKPEDYLSTENRQQFSDYIPRGFAVNYGKPEKDYSNFNQEIEKHDKNQRIGIYDSRSSVVNDGGKKLNSGQENYYEGFPRGNKNKNGNRRENFREEGNEDVLNSNSDEDKFERERQREVDNTILNRKIVNNENGGGFNYEYDAEIEKLTSENPPSVESGSYYDKENYFADESNVPFPRNNNNNNDNNRNLNTSKDQTRLQQSSGERRSSGGFRNGLGNGFPSPNRELPGSNAITGTTINLHPQKSQDYSNLKDVPNFNSQSSLNKETGYTDVRPNTENNGFSGDDISVTSSVETSFGKNTEFTTRRDNSRAIENEFALYQGNNLPKESFETGFYSNENRRNENSNQQNERNQYVPPFNY